MFIDPVALIDQTTRNLEDIAELLADEFDERFHPALTPGSHICRDAHATIRSLIPKLRAARAVQLAPAQVGMRPQCIDCD